MLRVGVEATMRALPTILLTLLCATTASAQPRTPDGRNKYADTEGRTLTAAEVQRYAAPYYSPLRSCYLQHGLSAKGATGELALQIVIHRDGYIRELKFDAPGVKGVALKRLDRCIRDEVLTWHFPPRRDFTTAVLPYKFVFLALPHAGPYFTCWKAQGCPDARPAKNANGRRP